MPSEEKARKTFTIMWLVGKWTFIEAFKVRVVACWSKFIWCSLVH